MNQNQTAIVVIQEVAISKKLANPDEHPKDWDIGKNDWQHIACCEEQQKREIELKFVASDYEGDERTKEERQNH
jgi:hypothetical protein